MKKFLIFAVLFSVVTCASKCDDEYEKRRSKGHWYIEGKKEEARK